MAALLTGVSNKPNSSKAVETSEGALLWAMLLRFVFAIEDFNAGCGEPPADVRLDIRGILVDGPVEGPVLSFTVDVPFTEAASATPSLEPTVLTDGEPAMVGSCCLLLARRETSDDFVITVGVFREGEFVAEDVMGGVLGLGRDFEGGVDGTAILWAPDDTEALRLATRCAVDDGMPGICIGGRSGSVDLGLRASADDNV